MTQTSSHKPIIRWIRRLGLILLLLILAILIWLWQLDLNEYRPRIEAELSDLIGRDVRLGHLSHELLPHVAVVAEDLSITGVDDHLLTASSVSFEMGLFSLLSADPDLSDLTVDGLKLHLVRNQEGEWNLLSLLESMQQNDPGEQRQDNEAALQVSRIMIDNARISIADEQTGQHLQLHGLNVMVTDFGQPRWTSHVDGQLDFPAESVRLGFETEIVSEWPQAYRTSLNRLVMSAAPVENDASQDRLDLVLHDPGIITDDLSIHLPSLELTRGDSSVSGRLGTESLISGELDDLFGLESKLEMILHGRDLPRTYGLHPDMTLISKLLIDHDNGDLRLQLLDGLLNDSPLSGELRLVSATGKGKIHLDLETLDLGQLLSSESGIQQADDSHNGSAGLPSELPLIHHFSGSISIATVLQNGNRISGVMIDLNRQESGVESVP